MRITTGRGNAAKSTEIATGYLFRRRPAEERSDVVSVLCGLLGIK